MIVARSFSPPKSSFLSEKNDLTDSRNGSLLRQRSRSPRRSTASPSRAASISSISRRSEPVEIPSRTSASTKSSTKTRPTPVIVVKKPAKPTKPIEIQQLVNRPPRQTAHEILSATAIPRRKGRPAQRLPRGDHVAEFSKLLFEDIQSNKDGLARSLSLPNADNLFGNIDELVEGQIIVGSESLDEGSLSARSISSDSLASMGSPDDFCTTHAECRSSLGRPVHGRSTPRISHSEDCSLDHPLVELDKIEKLSLNSTSDSEASSNTAATSRTTSPTPRTSKKDNAKSSLKSTLTSSLKALTSAAKSTLLSPYSSSSSSSLYTNESLLAHNFFDIQPSLTDDRRPPVSVHRPSPELRRYLNPQMAMAAPDSPTQLHFWQDERDTYDVKRESRILKEKIKQKSARRRSPGPKSKLESLPRVVPLSTCLPPTVRTANASSPPIWLTPDGEPINKNTSNPLLYDPESSVTTNNGMPRNREPRENRDFLRMYVCEAAMRKSGKLSDDLAAGRARLWLPPLVRDDNTNTQSRRKRGAERWQSYTAADSVK